MEQNKDASGGLFDHLRQKYKVTSGKDLSAKIGLSVFVISRVANNQNRLTDGHLATISQKTGISIKKLAQLVATAPVESPNTTKDGIEVKAGQVWRDLDYRMGGRLRSIVAVVDGKAVMCGLGTCDLRTTKVSISRMDKASKRWELVSEVAA